MPIEDDIDALASSLAEKAKNSQKINDKIDALDVLSKWYVAKGKATPKKAEPDKPTGAFGTFAEEMHDLNERDKRQM